MKNLVCTWILAASMVLSFVGNSASANVIVGPPSIPYAGSVGGSANSTLGSFWGTQFTANQYSHLVSFDFNQSTSSDNAGTITLNDVTSDSTVDTWSVPLNPSPSATVSFSGDDILKTGDVYQLFYTQNAGLYSNEKLQYIYTDRYTPYRNSDITVTNGFENNSTDTGIWYAFSNITTVPEPSTFAMLGLGGLVLAIRRRRVAA